MSLDAVVAIEPPLLRTQISTPNPAPAAGFTTTIEGAASGATEVAEMADAWELVEAAQQGDKAAFGLLYHRYVHLVFRYVLFRLGDRELAEDLTSETFVRAFRRISSISYQGRDVGAWFITIARNLVLDHVKSSRFRSEILTGEIAQTGAGSGAERNRTRQPGPEEQTLTHATRDELLRCVTKLGDDQQECIVLRFIQGFSVAETAHLMHRNEGAVKALQHRAVRRLADLLPPGMR